jgi:hypothetical protein
MAKNKKKQSGQGITSSQQRLRKRLTESRHDFDKLRFIAKARTDTIEQIKNHSTQSEETVLQENEPIHINTVRTFTEDDLTRRRLEIEEKRLDLDPAVNLLFIQTSLGEITDEGYRKKLMDPAVSADSIYEAISLGIKAWTPILFSKERS